VAYANLTPTFVGFLQVFKNQSVDFQANLEYFDVACALWQNSPIVEVVCTNY